jgi:hypothetical protein
MQAQRTQPSAHTEGGPRHESSSAQLGPRAGTRPAPTQHLPSAAGGRPGAHRDAHVAGHERADRRSAEPPAGQSVCGAPPAGARRREVRAGVSCRLVGVPGDSPRPDEQGRGTALTGRAAALASSAAAHLTLVVFPRRSPGVPPSAKAYPTRPAKRGFWLLRASEHGPSPAQTAGDGPCSLWCDASAPVLLPLPTVETKRPANPRRPAIHGRAARVYGTASGSDPDRSSARPTVALAAPRRPAA